MDTATIEDRSVEDLKEIITRIGGWPVVEGGAWKEDNFKWWDLSMRAAEEGFGTDRMISIGKNIYNAHSPKAQTTFMMKTIFHPRGQRRRRRADLIYLVLKQTKILRLHNKSKGLRKKNN